MRKLTIVKVSVLIVTYFMLFLASACIAEEDIRLLSAGCNPAWGNSATSLYYNKGKKSESGRHWNDNEIVHVRLMHDGSVKSFKRILSEKYVRRGEYSSRLKRLIASPSHSEQNIAVIYNELNWGGNQSRSSHEYGLMVASLDKLDFKILAFTRRSHNYEYGILNAVSWIDDETILYSIFGSVMSCDKIGFTGEIKLAEGKFAVWLPGAKVIWFIKEGKAFAIKRNATGLQPLALKMPKDKKVTGFNVHGDQVYLSYQNVLITQTKEGVVIGTVELPVIELNNISISPDGRKIAFDDGKNVYIMSTPTQ